MARQLGMKKQNVSKAIAVLVREKVLLVDDQYSKYRRKLKLNDKYAWKGKLKHLDGQQRSYKKKGSKIPDDAKG
jgi:hypothetical protein